MMIHEDWVLDGGSENIEMNNSTELYNLKNDIGEMNNLVKTEKKKRDELLDQLLNWIETMEAPMPSEANSEYMAKE